MRTIGVSEKLLASQEGICRS